MHVDKMQTHVVSFILHIDSSDDAEPWPIFIEDLQGRTHEVTLTPGDMVGARSTWRIGQGTTTSSSLLFLHYSADSSFMNLPSAFMADPSA